MVGHTVLYAMNICDQLRAKTFQWTLCTGRQSVPAEREGKWGRWPGCKGGLFRHGRNHLPSKPSPALRLWGDTICCRPCSIQWSASQFFIWIQYPAVGHGKNHLLALLTSICREIFVPSEQASTNLHKQNHLESKESTWKWTLWSKQILQCY